MGDDKRARAGADARGGHDEDRESVWWWLWLSVGYGLTREEEQTTRWVLGGARGPAPAAGSEREPRMTRSMAILDLLTRLPPF